MEETTKRDFTEVDIARALVDIPEYKKKVLCSLLKLEELMALACDEKNFIEYRLKVMDQVDIYLAFADALHLFHDNLASCKNTDKWMDEVAQRYKELDIPDRVKLSKKLTENGDLETSLELFKETWGNLADKLSGKNNK